jgi:hypothetical protein
MKRIILTVGIVVLGVCFAAANLRAADAKSYQVTGPVLEVNDTYIVVQKAEDKWQLACDKSTKGSVKVGDKVTVHYQMVATKVEAKTDKAAKPAKKN